MNKLLKLKYLYKLKEVERKTRTAKRNESVADHVYSMTVLAHYLLSISGRKVDYEKLIKLIIYHDIAEIGIDDTFVLDYKYDESEKQKEEAHNKSLESVLPEELYAEYYQYCEEYLQQSSLEARYASGIDALDPVVQSLDIKENWIGFNEKNIRKHKEHRVKEFPEQLALLEEVIAYIKQQGYIESSSDKP